MTSAIPSEAIPAPINKPPQLTGFGEPLEVSDFHKEVIDDLRWAEREYQAGHFDQYQGKHVAVLNHTVVGASDRVNELLEQISREHPGIVRNRIGLFFVDPGDWQ